MTEPTATVTEQATKPAEQQPESAEQATTQEAPKPARLRIPHCNC